MRNLIVAISILLSTCGFRCEQPTVILRTFLWLPTDQTLEVDFVSHGCFHYETYRLVFERSWKYTVAVTQFEYDFRQDTIRFGELELERSHLEGLDNLFRFYRTRQAGACTTVDSITIVRRRNGKVLSVERFADATCATYEWEGVVTTIPEIVALARYRNADSMGRAEARYGGWE